jgi:formylmethanofuran dehydrogenase subunit B
MGPAWIDGAPVALDAAGAEAARLLGASRLPVIAGLGTDVAGARAALALARRVGGVVDHMHSGALLRNLDVMREGGMIVTTQNEARLRADVLLLVGEGVFQAWPRLQEIFILAGSEHGTIPKRRLWWLCPGRGGPRGPTAGLRPIGRESQDLPILIPALRARVADRPFNESAIPPAAIKELVKAAADLRAARFGVAAWSAAHLDSLAIEMLCGLIDDLNGATRFAGLPLAPEDNAAGVMTACGWTTGYPMRTGLARGQAEHDPWRFDATRLVDSGEADCALWISAYGDARPGWNKVVPTIALTGPQAQMTTRVRIAVGCPGIDHASIEHLADIGTLASIPAHKPSEALSVAQAIARIEAALPNRGAGPC